MQFEIEIQLKDEESVLCEDHISVLPYEGACFEGSAGILRVISKPNEDEHELRVGVESR